MKKAGIIILFMLAGLSARAQFFSSGDDPGKVKWSVISSSDFRIIYPAGSDSLALEYGRELERFKTALGYSIGYTPNSQYRRPMPVLLHPFTAISNGSVAWAPRRMDLYTRPGAVSPDPMPWVSQLAVHESRHVSQMQFARDRGYGVFNALTGDLFTGAMSALYPGPALLEGDAVVAETALTNSGRGRTADFLEYYRVSFASGDFRDWYRWRWGSQKYYTPDHYRAGYMLVSGMRYTYDDPLFMKRYYDNIVSPWWPLPMFVLKKTVKQDSGMNLKGTWKEIAAAQQALWAGDEAARGPFGPVRQLTAPRRRYAEYLSPETAGDETFAIRKSITAAPKLVRLLPDGKESVVRPLASGVETIRYSDGLGRLFWSEIVPDPRWTLKSDSRIMYLEPGGTVVRSLTREGNLFNPSPEPSGERVSVTEYPSQGGSAVRIISGRDGTTLHRYPAPDGLQVVETAWRDGKVIASGISSGGFAFYDVTDGYRRLTTPGPAKVKQLRSSADGVLFVADMNGVNELYRLEADGSVSRLTNHRFGASDFLPAGDSLIFAALTPEGRYLYSEPAPAEALNSKPANDPWPVAGRLSAQEAALAGPSPMASPGFSDPKPYRKVPHLFHLHSWVPLYVDQDVVASSSFESITTSAGLGATAFFQNTLGTADLMLGYSAAQNTEYKFTEWVHSAHARFTYSGLYPIIELSTDIGDRKARQYSVSTLVQSNRNTTYINIEDSDIPSVRGSARIYVPFNFSRNGWQRGLVPNLSLTVSNDMVNTTEILYELIRIIGDNPGVARVNTGAIPGSNVLMARGTASLRGYAMQPVPRAGIYPRWGIGVEGGVSFRPAATELFSPSAFAFLYGYVPGVMDTHGIKLTATLQRSLKGRFPDNNVKALPRGMSGVSGLQSYLSTQYDLQAKATLDYAMPLLPIDWSGLGPVAYVRNLELTLHADGTFLGAGRQAGSGRIPRPARLYSAGADIVVRLGNLLWIPYSTRIGVSVDFNGGSILENLAKLDYEVPGHHVGMILSVDLP